MVIWWIEYQIHDDDMLLENIYNPLFFKQKSILNGDIKNRRLKKCSSHDRILNILNDIVNLH